MFEAWEFLLPEPKNFSAHGPTNQQRQKSSAVDKDFLMLLGIGDCGGQENIKIRAAVPKIS